MKTILETKEDKVNYLKGLIRIAKCNGVVEQEEMEYFSLIATGFELDKETIDSINKLWLSEEVINIQFSSRYIAVFFLQEAFQLCMVDDTFDEMEKKEIALIGDELGISKDDFTRLFFWAAEGMEWKKRGEEIISEIAKEK